MPVLNKLTGNDRPEPPQGEGEKRAPQSRRLEPEIIPGRPGYARM